MEFTIGGNFDFGTPVPDDVRLNTRLQTAYGDISLARMNNVFPVVDDGEPINWDAMKKNYSDLVL